MSNDAKKQPITMLTDRVLVQIPNSEDRLSKGGLLIPATAQISRRLAWAEVVCCSTPKIATRSKSQVRTT